MVVAAVDWTVVMVHLLDALVVLVPAYLAWTIRKQLRTPSGKHIGKLVEDVQHTALANHYRLRSVTGELGAEAPPEAEHEEAKVEGLSGE